MLDHAIFWHVYPLGATGAPIRERTDEGVTHRFGALLPWLDYARELGCNGLLLGPIFESDTHGYDTLDHFRIDPRLGDHGDWDALVAEAHGRGMSVVLDGVFNHVAMTHELVGRARAGGGMIRMKDGHVWTWEGHATLAELDHSDPRVVSLVAEIMCHWLRRGADGWRLDVAYAVPSEFWAAVLARVREEFPGAIFLGEVIHGDYGAIARAGTLDAVTQYELWKAVWSSLADRNLFELSSALTRHDEFCREARMQTFVGNHDVARIASTVGDSGAALAAAILFTVPGIPSVYYGDEQAFRGVKGEGYASDDPLRPPLPAAPGDLAAEGWWLYRIHQDLIALRRRHPWIGWGRLTIGETANEVLSYAVEHEGNRLEVELALGATPAVLARVGGVVEFAWPR